MCSRHRPVSDKPTRQGDQGDPAAPHWPGRAFALTFISPNPAQMTVWAVVIDRFFGHGHAPALASWCATSGLRVERYHKTGEKYVRNSPPHRLSQCGGKWVQRGHKARRTVPSPAG